ncbi:hypothetical protein ACFQKF_21970 [Halalkalicoccus sp. GCM10025322]|uniref:hypothetical protein n=1 Tax=Halalkalicoccus TaxID=332246 RepID=UPI002F968FE4
MSPDNNDTPDDESEDGEEEDVGQKEPDEDKEEEEREDEEETELPQPEDDETGIPPDTGFTFSADFIKKLEESLNPNIDVSQFIDVHRELEKYAETQKEMLKAATSHDIDLDQFKVTLPLENFGITKETNRALAESINPQIFRINKDLKNAVANDFYETVAALNQIAQQGASQPEESDEPTPGEIFEEEVIDEVAEEVVENDEYPSELKERAHTIRETDSREEKQDAFNQMYELAEGGALTMLELTVAAILQARIYAILVYMYAKVCLTWNGSDE